MTGTLDLGYLEWEAVLPLPPCPIPLDAYLAALPYVRSGLFLCPILETKSYSDPVPPRLVLISGVCMTCKYSPTAVTTSRMVEGL